MPRPSVTAGLHAHLTAPEDDGTAGSGLAVLFCDLDGMYVINHRYGFRAGDAVLVEVARRLSGVVGDQDTVARVGGDEFVVLAESQGAADAQDLAVRLREAIIPPIAVGDVTVEVDASLGLAWAACGDSAEDVLKAADLRMYEEKRARERARRGQTASETAAPEPGIVPWPPARATGAWVPQRPPVQRQFVRTWQTEGAAAPAPPGTAEIGSTEALSHLAGTSHIHRVVCRGDVADLSPLSLLPSLRTLVIAGNSALSDLAALDGCPKLRSLDVSGCERLTDWSAVARSGIVFLTVSCAPSAVPRLSGLVGARRLRELRLLTDVDGGCVDRGSLNSDTRSGETASGQSGHGQSETGIDLDALHAIPRLRINLNPRAPSG
jgi:diguanylate cyclase (GGDEF)-like protein